MEKKNSLLLEQVLLTLRIYEIVPTQREKKILYRMAVSFVKNGDAQVLMKGLCSTAIFLKEYLIKKMD